MKQTAGKMVELGWGTLNMNNRWHCTTGGLSIVYEKYPKHCNLSGIGVVKELFDLEKWDDNVT